MRLPGKLIKMEENQLAGGFCSAPFPSPCLEGRDDIGGEAFHLKIMKKPRVAPVRTAEKKRRTCFRP